MARCAIVLLILLVSIYSDAKPAPRSTGTSTSIRSTGSERIFTSTITSSMNLSPSDTYSSLEESSRNGSSIITFSSNSTSSQHTSSSLSSFGSSSQSSSSGSSRKCRRRPSSSRLSSSGNTISPWPAESTSLFNTSSQIFNSSFNSQFSNISRSEVSSVSIYQSKASVTKYSDFLTTASETFDDEDECWNPESTYPEHEPEPTLSEVIANPSAHHQTSEGGHINTPRPQPPLLPEPTASPKQATSSPGNPPSSPQSPNSNSGQPDTGNNGQANTDQLGNVIPPIQAPGGQGGQAADSPPAPIPNPNPSPNPFEISPPPPAPIPNPDPNPNPFALPPVERVTSTPTILTIDVSTGLNLKPPGSGLGQEPGSASIIHPLSARETGQILPPDMSLGKEKSQSRIDTGIHLLSSILVGQVKESSATSRVSAGAPELVLTSPDYAQQATATPTIYRHITSNLLPLLSPGATKPQQQSHPTTSVGGSSGAHSSPAFPAIPSLDSVQNKQGPTAVSAISAGKSQATINFPPVSSAPPIESPPRLLLSTSPTTSAASPYAQGLNTRAGNTEAVFSSPFTGRTSSSTVSTNLVDSSTTLASRTIQNGKSKQSLFNPFTSESKAVGGTSATGGVLGHTSVGVRNAGTSPSPAALGSSSSTSKLDGIVTAGGSASGKFVPSLATASLVPTTDSPLLCGSPGIETNTGATAGESMENVATTGPVSTAKLHLTGPSVADGNTAISHDMSKSFQAHVSTGLYKSILQTATPSAVVLSTDKNHSIEFSALSSTPDRSLPSLPGHNSKIGSRMAGETESSDTTTSISKISKAPSLIPVISAVSVMPLSEPDKSSNFIQTVVDTLSPSTAPPLPLSRTNLNRNARSNLGASGPPLGTTSIDISPSLKFSNTQNSASVPESATLSITAGPRATSTTATSLKSNPQHGQVSGASFYLSSSRALSRPYNLQTGTAQTESQVNTKLSKTLGSQHAVRTGIFLETITKVTASVVNVVSAAQSPLQSNDRRSNSAQVSAYKSLLNTIASNAVASNKGSAATSFHLERLQSLAPTQNSSILGLGVSDQAVQSLYNTQSRDESSNPEISAQKPSSTSFAVRWANSSRSLVNSAKPSSQAGISQEPVNLFSEALTAHSTLPAFSLSKASEQAVNEESPSIRIPSSSSPPAFPASNPSTLTTLAAPYVNISGVITLLISPEPAATPSSTGPFPASLSFDFNNPNNLASKTTRSINPALPISVNEATNTPEGPLSSSLPSYNFVSGITRVTNKMISVRNTGVEITTAQASERDSTLYQQNQASNTFQFDQSSPPTVMSLPVFLQSIITFETLTVANSSHPPASVLPERSQFSLLSEATVTQRVFESNAASLAASPFQLTSNTINEILAFTSGSKLPMTSHARYLNTSSSPHPSTGITQAAVILSANPLTVPSPLYESSTLEDAGLHSALHTAPSTEPIVSGASLVNTKDTFVSGLTSQSTISFEPTAPSGSTISNTLESKIPGYSLTANMQETLGPSTTNPNTQISELTGLEASSLAEPPSSSRAGPFNGASSGTVQQSISGPLPDLTLHTSNAATPSIIAGVLPISATSQLPASQAVIETFNASNISQESATFTSSPLASVLVNVKSSLAASTDINISPSAQARALLFSSTVRGGSAFHKSANLNSQTLSQPILASLTEVDGINSQGSPTVGSFLQPSLILINVTEFHTTTTVLGSEHRLGSKAVSFFAVPSMSLYSETLGKHIKSASTVSIEVSQQRSIGSATEASRRSITTIAATVYTYVSWDCQKTESGVKSPKSSQLESLLGTPGTQVGPSFTSSSLSKLSLDPASVSTAATPPISALTVLAVLAVPYSNARSVSGSLEVEGGANSMRSTIAAVSSVRASPLPSSRRAIITSPASSTGTIASTAYVYVSWSCNSRIPLLTLSLSHQMSLPPETISSQVGLEPTTASPSSSTTDEKYSASAAVALKSGHRRPSFTPTTQNAASTGMTTSRALFSSSGTVETAVQTQAGGIMSGFASESQASVYSMPVSMTGTQLESKTSMLPTSKVSLYSQSFFHPSSLSSVTAIASIAYTYVSWDCNKAASMLQPRNFMSTSLQNASPSPRSTEMLPSQSTGFPSLTQFYIRSPIPGSTPEYLSDSYITLELGTVASQSAVHSGFTGQELRESLSLAHSSIPKHPSFSSIFLSSTAIYIPSTAPSPSTMTASIVDTAEGSFKTVSISQSSTYANQNLQETVSFMSRSLPTLELFASSTTSSLQTSLASSSPIPVSSLYTYVSWDCANAPSASLGQINSNIDLGRGNTASPAAPQSTMLVQSSSTAEKPLAARSAQPSTYTQHLSVSLPNISTSHEHQSFSAPVFTGTVSQIQSLSASIPETLLQPESSFSMPLQVSGSTTAHNNVSALAGITSAYSKNTGKATPVIATVSTPLEENPNSQTTSNTRTAFTYVSWECQSATDISGNAFTNNGIAAAGTIPSSPTKSLLVFASTMGGVEPEASLSTVFPNTPDKSNTFGATFKTVAQLSSTVMPLTVTKPSISNTASYSAVLTNILGEFAAVSTFSTLANSNLDSIPSSQTSSVSMSASSIVTSPSSASLPTAVMSTSGASLLYLSSIPSETDVIGETSGISSSSVPTSILIAFSPHFKIPTQVISQIASRPSEMVEVLSSTCWECTASSAIQSFSASTNRPSSGITSNTRIGASSPEPSSMSSTMQTVSSILETSISTMGFSSRTSTLKNIVVSQTESIITSSSQTAFTYVSWDCGISTEAGIVAQTARSSLPLQPSTSRTNLATQTSTSLSANANTVATIVSPSKSSSSSYLTIKDPVTSISATSFSSSETPFTYVSWSCPTGMNTAARSTATLFA